MGNRLTGTLAVCCPWCEKGETLSNRRADIIVSCKCSNCGRIYTIDFNTLTAKKGSASKRKQNNINGFII